MSIYDYSVKNRNGENISISQFKGNVLLIVNTATFLVDREGNVVYRFSPTYKPEEIEEKIKELI